MHTQSLFKIHRILRPMNLPALMSQPQCQWRVYSKPVFPPPVAGDFPVAKPPWYRKLNFVPQRLIGTLFKVNRSVKTEIFSSLEDNSLDLESMKLDTGGPPRWFSPLECGSRSNGSPLLFFLPGIDGDGNGLKLHKKKLGEIFDIWCLHVPVTDQTPLMDLVKMVNAAIRSEHELTPEKPIYLVGESFGACLALVVASQNPDIDLILLLANPAAFFSKSLIENIGPLSNMIPKHLHAGLQYMMSLMPETFFWKLRMLHEVQNYLSSRHDTIKARTLILNSGNYMLLPSMMESERFHHLLPNCEIRRFIGHGHPLFLENGFDLVAIVKCSSYYRHGPCIDYVSDFLPPSPSEFKIAYEPWSFMDVAVNPVMLSTLDSGQVIRGLGGIPFEGPVLLVGNHMMLGMDVVPLLYRFWTDKNITLRGMAHPVMFKRLRHGKLPDMAVYDLIRILGGVPVSATNLYRLLSLKSHVALYPGGARETFHLKGEDYKLIWPVEQEFVRMAAKFGTKIIPFGVIGEDDVGQLLLDCDDQMKIPPLKAFIEELNDETIRLRTDAKGEIGKQYMHYPVILPKFPGRFYYLFGKPILTEGLKYELQNKDKAREMYTEIKCKIQKCISYLKEKREKDPYRNLLARMAYQEYYGHHSEIPTFEI